MVFVCKIEYIVMQPEQGDLDKIGGPPHSRWLHQIPSE